MTNYLSFHMSIYPVQLLYYYYYFQHRYYYFYYCYYYHEIIQSNPLAGWSLEKAHGPALKSPPTSRVSAPHHHYARNVES